MPGTTLMWLLAVRPEVVPPTREQILSSGTGSAFNQGIVTTLLLDPALPALSSGGGAHRLSVLIPQSTTLLLPFGRWVTRPLPAQAIGALTWTLLLGWHFNNTPGSNLAVSPGLTVAQYRPASGVVGTLVNAAIGSGTSTGGGIASDVMASVAAGGSSATFAAGDCLLIEVLLAVQNASATALPIADLSFSFGGFDLYPNGSYKNGTFTNLAAQLSTSSAVAFS